MKKRWIAFVVFAALAGGYALWSASGRAVPDEPMDLELAHVLRVGPVGAKGNLVGIQPWMVPADYASEARFRDKMAGYFQAARAEGLLTERSVVVLPEYLGTWLVAVGEKREVYEADTVQEAMTVLVASNLLGFATSLKDARGQDRVKDALFRMKAPAMAATYQRVFAALADEHDVTVVAGSIVLPEPTIEDGQLVPGERGPLYNVSVVYGPDGRAQEPLVKKVFPIDDEKPFTRAARASELPTFETPAGRLGVLICADSWYPGTYETLAERGADLVAVPSFLGGDGSWGQPWRGYNGARAPLDVDDKDKERLTEGEAWLKYALAGRMSTARARYGLNVFLRGRLWDLGSDGITVARARDEVFTGPRVPGAVILSMGIE